MKKIACLTVMSLAIWFPGCKSGKINVIHTDAVVTNSVPVKAFNDETYIWETWQFGTNRVDRID